MARVRDLPLAMRKQGIWQFLLALYTQITEDDVFVWAAALAYSWLFALFPFLIFLLTLLPYLPDEQKKVVLNSIDDFLRQLPAETALTVQAQVDATVRRVLMETQGGLMSFGLIMALWVASGGMAQTMTALDRCYDVTEGRRYHWQRLRAIGLTIIVGTLMLLVIVLLPIGGIVLQWVWDNSQRLIGYQLPTSLKITLDIARWVIGLFLLMAVLNVVYHYGCQVKRRYRFLTPGAVFCILTWVAMGLAFRIYVDRIAVKGYNQTYGALGGVVILMFLFYLSAIILLVGAEINSEVDYTVHTAPRGTKDFREFERARAEADKKQKAADQPVERPEPPVE